MTDFEAYKPEEDQAYMRDCSLSGLIDQALWAVIDGRDPSVILPTIRTGFFSDAEFKEELEGQISLYQSQITAARQLLDAFAALAQQEPH